MAASDDEKDSLKDSSLHDLSELRQSSHHQEEQQEQQQRTRKNASQFENQYQNLYSRRTDNDLEDEIDEADELLKSLMVPARVEEKSWNNLDSVHSRASTIRPSLAATPFAEEGNASSELGNDSCCSFASFGDSSSSLNDSSSLCDADNATSTKPNKSSSTGNSSNTMTIEQASLAFQRLTEDAAPRQRTLFKSQSMRGLGLTVNPTSRGGLKRGLSYRGTGLTLIEESSSLD